MVAKIAVKNLLVAHWLIHSPVTSWGERKTGITPGIVGATRVKYVKWPRIAPWRVKTMSEKNDDLSMELKRRLEETRLPADQKELILANLPLPEERQRLFKQMQEEGGLSSEEFFAALGFDELQP
jgi:hypothetical protein